MPHIISKCCNISSSSYKKIKSFSHYESAFEICRFQIAEETTNRTCVVRITLSHKLTQSKLQYTLATFDMIYAMVYLQSLKTACGGLNDAPGYRTN